MIDDQNMDWKKVDYVWDNFSLYGRVKKLKRYDDTEASEKPKAVNEKKLVRSLLSDSGEREEVQRMLKNDLCYDNGEKIKLSLLRYRDQTYLTDGGVTVRYLQKKYGSEKEKIAEYIARIATKRKLCFIGESLCMLLESDAADGNDYGEMISLLWKIQKFGGYGYV